MRETNIYDRQYNFKDHIIIFGSCEVRDLRRFMLMLIDREEAMHFPIILIVGEKKLEETDLITLLKHKYLQEKIHYLSVEDGIDFSAFRKACLGKAKAIFFFSPMKIDKDTEART